MTEKTPAPSPAMDLHIGVSRDAKQSELRTPAGTEILTLFHRFLFSFTINSLVEQDITHSQPAASAVSRCRTIARAVVSVEGKYIKTMPKCKQNALVLHNPPSPTHHPILLLPLKIF